jgi:hypothetical protein
MTLTLTDCRPEHLRAIRLRAEDEYEVNCLGMTAAEALWRSYRGSVLRRAATLDGRVAAVWGVGGSSLGLWGEPWLLTAAEVERVPVTMVRVARQELHAATEIFPLLQNYVAAEYRRAVRFVELLGFALDAPVPMGPSGIPFRRFWMER